MKKFEVYGERRFGTLPEKRSILIIAKNKDDARDKAYIEWNKNMKSWMHEILITNIKEIK